MKFNQFSSYEKIITELEISLLFLKENLKQDFKENTFILLPELNILIDENIDISLLKEVLREYKFNKNFLRKILAKSLIILITIMLKVKIIKLFYKAYKIQSPDFYPVIIGGNNRF